MKLITSITLLFALFCNTVDAIAQKKPGGLWTVDISHDDKYIALGGDDSLLRIYTSGLKLFKTIQAGEKGMIRALHWHPKKNLLAISSRNKVWLYDPETGKEIFPEGEINGSRTIAWNQSGELLAAAAGHGVVWIWDKQGKLLRKIQKRSEDGQADRKDFLGMDWHPSKDIFTTVGDEVRVFDTSGKQLSQFKHRQQRAGLLTVKWHPSGEFFVTGDYGHANEGIPTLLQFWKPDGTLIREIKESKMEYRNMRWSKDGSKLATASDALRIWTKDGELLHSAGEGNTVFWGVDWDSSSGNLVTVTYETGAIQSWTSKGKLLTSLY